MEVYYQASANRQLYFSLPQDESASLQDGQKVCQRSAIPLSSSDTREAQDGICPIRVESAGKREINAQLHDDDAVPIA